MHHEVYCAELECIIRPITLNMFLAFLSMFYLWNIEGIHSDPSFTSTPPNEQFALKGSNVSFPWNYNNDGFTLLFGRWGKEPDIYITQTSGSNAESTDKNKYILLQLATLKVVNVNLNSSGKYYCTLNFRASTTFKFITSEGTLIVVNNVPNFTSPLLPKTIGTEGSAELKLTVVVVGEKKPIVTWYKDGNVANTTAFNIIDKMIGTNAQNEIIIQSNLTLKSPHRTSNAVFLAKAVYGTFSPFSNTSTVVDVWYAPENAVVSSTKSGQAIGKGEQVVIKCSAVSHPSPKFTIFRNGTIILNNSLSGEYTINSFSRNDTGNYSCMAQNEVGTISVDGVSFTYNETKVIRATTSTIVTTASPTNISTTKDSTTIEPGQRKATSKALPWWAWLVIGIAIVLLITIPLAVYCFFMRKKQKSKSPVKFSKHADFLDNYIKHTNYSLGYENEAAQAPGPQSDSPQKNGDVGNNAESDMQLAMDNLGARFESEHDLLEHYKKGPSLENNDDDDDDGMKDYDPFASEESDTAVEISSQKSFGDEHGIHYETDDIYKVNTEDEAESSREAVSFVAFEDDEIIQYDI